MGRFSLFHRRWIRKRPVSRDNARRSRLTLERLEARNLLSVFFVDDSGGADFLTIQAAVDAIGDGTNGTIHSGDSIIVKDGTYNESVSISQKNTTAAGEVERIVLKSETFHGARVIPSGDHAFRLDGSRFLTIEGFELTGASREAIHLLGGSEANRDITLAGNTIHDNSGGVTIGPDNDRTWVVNNLLRDNAGNGLVAADDPAGDSPLYIVNNTFFANGLNGLSIGRDTRVFLVNNLIAANGTASGALGGGWGVFHDLSAVIEGGLDPGNGGSSGGSKGSGTSADPSRLTLIHNLFYRNGDGSSSGLGGDIANVALTLDASDRGNRTTTGTEGVGVVGSVFADGQATHAFTEFVVNPESGNFRLVTGSPALDQGVNSFMDDSSVNGGTERVPGVDFEGTARPTDGDLVPGAVADIGYDEGPVVLVIVDTDGDGIPDELDCNPTIYEHLVVDPEGALDGFIPDSRRFGTLQAAVIAALDNQVIGYHGNTVENIVIGDSTGTGGKDLRIVTGCGLRITAADPNLPVIWVEASAGADDGDTGAGQRDIHIDGLYAHGGSVGYLIETSKSSQQGTDTLLRSVQFERNEVGVLIIGNGNEVRDSDRLLLTHFTRFGIQVFGDNNRLIGNRIEDQGGTRIDVTGNGNLIRNNTVADTPPSSRPGHGIAVFGDENDVLENLVRNMSDDGINVFGSRNRIANNRVVDNGGDGIHVFGNANVLEDNDLFANLGDGMEVIGNNNQLRENVAGSRNEGNGGDGFVVQGRNNTLTDNVANANDGRGFYIRGVTSTGNRLRGNQSNTTRSDFNENAGAEYEFDVIIVNLGGNRKDDQNFTATARGSYE